jgi:hypothetical protein
MMRKPWLITVAVVLAASAVRADDSPLAQVPAKAPFVSYIRGFGRTQDRVMAMVKNAAPDFAPMVQPALENALKKELGGREVKGIPKDGAIFFAMMALPEVGSDEKPAAAAIVRVENYDEFRDGILKEEERKSLKKEEGIESAKSDDKDIYFVRSGDYAIVTNNKDTASFFTKKHEGLDKKLAPDLAKRLLDSDVALLVDMAAVNKKYGEQIQGVRQMVVPMFMQGAGEKMDKHAMETLQSCIEGVFQFLADSKSFLVAVDFRPEGLALHTGVRVGGDTPSNEYLKDAKPSALDEIGKLSQGQLAYCGVQFTGQFAQLYAKLMGAGGEAASAAAKDIAEAKPDLMCMDVNIPPQGLQVWHYQDPAKAVEGTLKVLESLESGGKYQNAAIKGKPEIKRDAENHRGFKLSSVRLTLDFDKMMEQAPGGAAKPMMEVMKKMVGETVSSWVGTDGKIFVNVSASSWPKAQQLLDEYLDGKSTVGSVKAFTEARGQLPAETTALELIDGPMFLELGSQLLAPVLQQMNAQVKMQPFRATRGASYLGMAITLRPENGTFDLWLPVSLIQEAKKMIPLGGAE